MHVRCIIWFCLRIHFVVAYLRSSVFLNDSIANENRSSADIQVYIFRYALESVLVLSGVSTAVENGMGLFVAGVHWSFSPGAMQHQHQIPCRCMQIVPLSKICKTSPMLRSMHEAQSRQAPSLARRCLTGSLPERQRCTCAASHSRSNNGLRKRLKVRPLTDFFI
jgi:hypothetical protein